MSDRVVFILAFWVVCLTGHVLSGTKTMAQRRISFIVLGILLLREVESICYSCGYKVREEKCVDPFIPRDGRESSACNLSRQSKFDLCRKYREGWTVMCKRDGTFLMCGEKCYTGQAASTNHSLCLILTLAFVFQPIINFLSS